MKEWLYFDWTPEAISSYGIMFFIAFGSCALFVQGRKIWKNKSSASVSAMWTFIFFFMFASYPIIGAERNNFLMVWQGVLRVLFYVPIAVGLHRFGGFTRKEITLAKVLFIMIFLMMEYPSTREFFFTIINFLGVFGVFSQGVLIKKEKSAGVVSALLLFAYAANAALWIWYNYEIGDLFLFVNALLFLAAYAYTIIMWIKFRRPEPI
jgi:uncharacterized protein with PQ loop repeat